MNVTVKPKPSYFLGIIVGLTYFAALVCLFLSGISFYISFALSLVVLAHAVYIFRRDIVLREPSSIVGVFKSAAGYRIEFFNGEVVSAVLHKDSIVTRYLIILNFKCEGKWFLKRVILLPDSAVYDALRRLRVVVGVG